MVTRYNCHHALVALRAILTLTVAAMEKRNRNDNTLELWSRTTDCHHALVALRAALTLAVAAVGKWKRNANTLELWSRATDCHQALVALRAALTLAVAAVVTRYGPSSRASGAMGRAHTSRHALRAMIARYGLCSCYLPR